MKERYFLPALLLMLLGSAASAQIPQAYADRLQFVLDSTCTARNIKGVSAAVAIPDVGIWEGVYGESHAGTPISSDMFLAVGSNTKTYVAVALLKLQEQGLLDLDDTVGTWIEHANIDGAITIRQLLNHTSGLYSYTASAAWGNAVFSDVEAFWDPQDLLPYVGAPNFTPGASWGYSNSNYLVAGLIIEQVTGELLGDHLTNALLAPAGLDSTVLYTMGSENLLIPHLWSDAISGNELEDLIADHAYSHNAVMTTAWAAGGMLATAKDNVQFWSKLIAGEILSEASWNELTTVVPLNATVAYGLGIFRYGNPNNDVVWSHGGTHLGFINENIADPVTGVAISVLTNQDSIGNGILLNELVLALHQVDLEEFTGIAEAAEVSFSIHPNPAADVVYLDLRGAGGVSEVAVVDLTGKVVLRRSLSPGVHQLKVDELVAGVYLVEVWVGGVRGVRRLVVG